MMMRTNVSVNENAIRFIIGAEWRDLVYYEFTALAFSECFPTRGMIWDSLDEFHSDYYDKEDQYITAYQNALEKRLKDIRNDYLKMYAELKERHTSSVTL